MSEIPHSEKMFHLPIEVSVYVPSTQDVDKVVSKSEMKLRVDEVKKYLATLFGGFSSSSVEGGFLASDGKVVKENVERVVSFAPKADFEKNKEALVQKASEWATKWGQEAIGLEHEGDLYYVPQKFENGGTIAIREAKEMANSQAIKIKHHVSELANILKSNPTIEAWVIAKLESASNDLADVTHYLDGKVQMSGKKMATGGSVGDKTIKVKAVYLEQQYFELTKEMEIPFSDYKEYDKTGKVPRELENDLMSETTTDHWVETNAVSVRLTPITADKMATGGGVQVPQHKDKYELGGIFHGSPYLFNKFTTEKIGSGIGQQEDGWGIYLTDDKESSKNYGQYIYNVTLFKNKNLDEYAFLDLKNPVKKDLVKKIVKAVYKHFNKDFDIDNFNSFYEYSKNKSLQKVNFNDYELIEFDYSGYLFYKTLSRILGGDKKASIFLLDNGVDGLRSLFKNSKGDVYRTDYVIFDENEITIESKEQLPNHYYADGGSIDPNSMEVQFIKYKDEEIMYEPHFKEYYVNDSMFHSLEEAKEFIDGGAPMSPEIKEAYRKGLFEDGGTMPNDFAGSEKNVDGWNQDYTTDPITIGQKKAKETATRVGMAIATRGTSEISRKASEGGDEMSGENKMDMASMLKGMKG